MAEEQRLQEPGGGHRLCANNCGFFGSQTTHNFCSKCYKDLCIEEQQIEEAKLAMVNTLNKQSHESESESSSSLSPSSSKFPISSVDNLNVCPGGQQELIVEKPKIENDSNNVVEEEQSKSPRVAVGEAVRPNRCATCRKRVGLIGFKCRCGVTFCGSHRYPEQHGCTFDYKTLGKEEIAKANPVVIAKKLEKI